MRPQDDGPSRKAHGHIGEEPTAPKRIKLQLRKTFANTENGNYHYGQVPTGGKLPIS